MALLETDFDPDDRELCDDGACTGILGEDGRCKECGRPSVVSEANESEGVPSGRGLPRGGAPNLRTTTPSGASASEPEENEGAFDPDRQLCPDGACTGLIGPNGHCKLCGALASP